jgi:phosphoribosyl 1,2-cyclic phosphodiesterase
MLVRFWGTRGSLPVAQQVDQIRRKVARALVAASGHWFDNEAEAFAYAEHELEFAISGTYGGATSCVEIEAGDDSFIVCDMGSGLREFGIDAARRCAAGHPKTYNFFMSHLHWDHIMGFPFFGPAFDPEATIIIHGGHSEIEEALRRQQEKMSFPVPFDALAATFRFVTLEPGQSYDIAGVRVSLLRQAHSNDSFGYRFEADGKAAIYSTDAEYQAERMNAQTDVVAFFRDADLVICDTMYSLGNSISMKQDWGHSSNLIAVDLCLSAHARRLMLFHHEPTYNDDDVARMHAETIHFEALKRGDGQPLEILCAYDGLEVTI